MPHSVSHEDTAGACEGCAAGLLAARWCLLQRHACCVPLRLAGCLLLLLAAAARGSLKRSHLPAVPCLHILVLALTPHLAFERSGLPAQYESDFFKFKHAAFYGVIKSKAGLSFAKAAVMRVFSSF
jgi:hypothetical protein